MHIKGEDINEGDEQKTQVLVIQDSEKQWFSNEASCLRRKLLHRWKCRRNAMQ
jgi:hypothetical protein